MGPLIKFHIQNALPCVKIKQSLACGQLRPSDAYHYRAVIMSAIGSQITGVSIIYSTISSGSDQRKHQSSASLAFVRGIHRRPVNSPHKGNNAENDSIWWRHHVCVSKLPISGSDNELSPGRYQAITWDSAGVLLIGTLGTDFGNPKRNSQIFIQKNAFEMPSAKWRQFCLGHNVLSELLGNRAFLSQLPIPIIGNTNS